MDIQPASMYPGQAGSISSVEPIVLPPVRRAEGGSAGESSEKSPDSAQVKQMVMEIEQHLRSMDVSLNFTPYGDKGEKMAVVVSNQKTGEVIREIPSKELQELYKKMNELVGIIFNRHV
jgi:flagellar protein FlaG